MEAKKPPHLRDSATCLERTRCKHDKSMLTLKLVVGEHGTNIKTKRIKLLEKDSSSGAHSI